MHGLLLVGRWFAAAAVSALLSACNSAAGYYALPGPPGAKWHVPNGSPKGKIKHLVIVIQENRSFNNLFLGFPGAKTAAYGYDSYGQKIKLLPVGLEAKYDIEHGYKGFFAACNGTGSIPGTNCRMNGFDKEIVTCHASCPIPHPQYAYVPRSETKPYFDIAGQYVLADQMYASDFDASSFVSHQYIISGQAQSAVNYPIGAWGCPGGPTDTIKMVGPQRRIPDGREVVCWNPTTLGDELDKAGLSWAYYALNEPHHSPPYVGIWSAYQAIQHIYYGYDWSKDVIGPPSQFLSDVSNGTLRAVSWVTPTWPDSDHPQVGSDKGPSWVASIVNAIGESPYWDSTAIFVFWDDYGGWYDPEPPAYVDYDGLGIRLPLLIVSAYAKKGHVSHVRYEHGSILKFVEDTFSLKRLSASDTRANSPARDCFDFSRPPRKFIPIGTKYNKNYFLRERPSFHVLDSQ